MCLCGGDSEVGNVSLLALIVLGSGVTTSGVGAAGIPDVVTSAVLTLAVLVNLARGLGLRALGLPHDPGVGPAGHQERRRDLAAVLAAELVLEALRVGLEENYVRSVKNIFLKS